jgi:beta-phosphoglucomutase
MVLKAIFLEFRGVLIDDRLIQSQVMQQLLLDQNLSLKPQEYEDLIREEDDRSCLQLLLERRGRSHSVAELNHLLEKRCDWTLEYLENALGRSSLLLPDVRDFLFRARALACKLVLMTSSIEREVKAILNLEQISPYFDLVLAGDKLPHQPIKPWAYTYGIESLNQLYPNLNLTPHNCLTIEPIYRYCDAARSVGISVAAVSRYRPIHFLQRRADWTVDRLTDLELDRIQGSLSPSVNFSA